ncbi:MAG: metallophosphoesterase [Bacteroidota bacterium]
MNAYYTILYGTPVLLLFAYRAFHLVSANWKKPVKISTRTLFLTIGIFVYVSTSYLAVNRADYDGNEFIRTYTIVGAITLSVTLLTICFFQLIADVILLIRIFSHKSKSKNNGKKLARRTFLNKIALGAGALVMGSFIWGTTKGKYGWRIEKNTLGFGNLPSSFDGMRIVQISDLHLGSFNKNFAPIEEAIEMVNELNPDYIFFTGDLVNESAEEGEDWIPIIRRLKAKYGKYSILGNHDYGWGSDISEKERVKNSLEVIKMNQKMDLEMLVNEHRILEKNGDKIGLIGVENWGYSDNRNWFPMRADYKKSVAGMEDVPFKLLLSHDPTHWDHHIVNKEDVDLTLAGHTHGGQLGIRIPGLFELSAGRMFYKRFAGAYREGKQHLYVNRGMGFLIFPGRVGMPTEITLHTLQRT